MSTSTVIYTLIGVDRASGAFRSAGMSADKTTSALGRLGKAATVAVAAIAGAAVTVGVESVKAAVTFQASMEKIHTQAGASQKSVDQLTRSVLKLAPSTQQGPQQLAEALYHLKSLGMDNAAAMKALAQSSNLAAVGGASLEDTATAIGAAWRSGIKGGQSFSKVAATVNAIIGAGNMRMEDFVQSLSSGILPAARTFGVGLSSVGAALALMTDEGIPAVDAATRLRMSLSLLGAPSAAANKALQAIGLSGTQLGEAMRGPQGIIGAISLLSDHLKRSGLDATQQAQVISKAFGGGRSSSAIMTMLNNLEVLRKKQAQINATTGNYGAAVAAQRKTAQAQFALLRSSVDTLGIRLGLDLLPPVTGFVKFLAGTALPAVEKFTGTVMHLLPVKTIEQDAGKVKSIILGLFGIHDQAAPKPVTLPVSLGRIRPQQFGALVSQMGARTPLTLPVTITGLKAQQLNAVLGQSFTALAGQPPPAGIGTWLASALGKVNWGKVLASAIDTAVSGAQQIGAAFLTLLGKINWVSFGGQLASITIGLAIGLVNNLVPALIGTAVHHPLDMLSFLAALIPIGRAAGVLIKIFDKIPLLGTLTKWVLGPLEKLGGGMETALGKVLKKVFGPVGAKIGSFFSGAKNWLAGKGETIILGLWYGAEHAWGTVTRWLGKIGSKVAAPFAKAGTWLLSAGGDVIGGLLKGIRDALSNIGHWVKVEIVDPIINWVKSWFGIHSPSTVMAGIGGHLMGGLFKGMMDGDLLGMVGKIFGSLPNALLHIAEKGLIGLAGLPLKAVHALEGLGAKGLGLLGKGLGKVLGTTQFNWTQMIGQAMAAQMGWTGANWTALQALWTRESGWNPYARNPSSGAYGIPQALPASKMASAGPDYLTNAVTQIKWGLGYIAGRYGNPVNAWGHEVALNWYGNGGRFAAGQLIGVGDKGPELVRFDRAGTVIPASRTASLYAQLGSLITQGLSGTLTVAGAEAAAVRLAAKVRAAFAAGQITAGQETRLLDRITRDIDSKGSRLVRTMTEIGLKMEAGLLSSLANADSAAKVKSVMGKLAGFVEQAWNAGGISAAKASALTRWLDQDNMRLQALAAKRQKIAAAIAAAQNYASTVASNTAAGAQLTSLPSVTSGGYITGSGIIADLHAQLSLIRRFGSDLKTLRDMGLSRALLSQVIAAGPVQGDQLAQALISSGAGGIAQANRTQAAIGKASSQLGKTAAEYMYDSGRQAGKGFLSGLKAQEAAISKVMAQIAKTLVKTLKKELGIHSPSKVTFGIGEFTGIGIEEGMLSRVRHIEAAGSRLAVAAVPGQRRAGGMSPVTAVAGSARGGEFTGNLYLDSGEFLGVVRGEIREHDRQLVGAASRGAGLAG